MLQKYHFQLYKLQIIILRLSFVAFCAKSFGNKFLFQLKIDGKRKQYTQNLYNIFLIKSYEKYTEQGMYFVIG